MFLNGAEKDAAILCEELYSVIKMIKFNEPVTNYIKHYIPYRCYEINLILAMRSYEEYKSNYDEKYLDVFFSYLKKSNEYIPDTYAYFLNLSIYYFSKYRNVAKAKECIDACKRIKQNNGFWRYSDAFLAAYEGCSLLTAYRKYKTAFKVSYDLIELSLFIEHVLELEPDKESLHFALGLIYEQIGHQELMLYHFNAFKIKVHMFSQGDTLLSIVSTILDSSTDEYNIV